ncbi:MAG: hypothetical protein J1F02_07900 [Lachnospiraceae bacterium]|nr:hypothetical protein [Lachnospiraceae bacterium]
MTEKIRTFRNRKRKILQNILEHYDELLQAETAARKAEKEACESMKTFGTSFQSEDLQRLLEAVDKIASQPQLTTEYYQQVNQQAHESR